MRFLTLVFMLWAGCLTAAVSVTGTSGATPLYDTYEITWSAPGVSGNKFKQFASVTFSQGGRHFTVDGFHDGGDTWRARFMPDALGTWSWSWAFQGDNGNGSFTCTARANAKAHGHVRVDAAHPRYLVYDDGSAYYGYGGKWINASNYGPATKGGQNNGNHKNDATLLGYLDAIAATGHNQLLLKTSLYPVENDGFTWDLTWVRRGEWYVREMADRGIYCQVGMFDTWARDKTKWFTYNTSGGSQVFNVWANGDESKKEHYIRYLVARFAGYYNVWWELGNEMEHKPNSGSAFASQANSKYLPWIRQYDPYALPIGLSENVWKQADVDVGFIHQTGTNSLPQANWTKPTQMNELVGGADSGVSSLWKDSAIRNSAGRLSFRRTFWRMFTYGGVGSFEATWMEYESRTNAAVQAVFADHGRLREFIEAIPININEMHVDASTITSGPRDDSCRSKPGVCYAAYFLGSRDQNTSAGTTSLNLPAGTYEARWYHPRTGAWTSPQAVTGGGTVSLAHPAFTEDLALLITISTGGGGVPPVIDAVSTVEVQPITGTAVTLQVAVTDPDTAPGDLTITWSVIDRPAGQAPDVPIGAAPVVDLHVAGTYRFGVTVSDDSGSDQDEIDVVVAQTASSLAVTP